MSFKLISPQLLAKFARASEDVAIIYELGLVGLYAGISKLVRRRALISLVEGDYRHLGRTGTVWAKVALRRLTARSIDLFIANNPPARDYLVETLKVPRSRIVTGWWLAGLPPDLPGRAPVGAGAPEGAPVFVYAGRLIAPKGVDMLIEAVAIHERATGPCALWIFGDGPEREHLVELASRRGVQDSVTFFGSVDPGALKGAMELCDALVFPTLQDLVGRVVVEALTLGVPVVVSPMTGAAGTVVQDGINGLVADPRDPRELADALARSAEPRTRRTLHEGARRSSAVLAPDAVAARILRAVALVRERRALPRAARREASAH
ncbi:glycosyltransferase family 4 protein [Actinomycetospora sp. NBRC 106375]|uniref:glycosyltransferase family 4 protein n=1 Tax=Actinomycetospora sp. NBRC 106375 TaxID=3032207 RepID=UPI002555F30B|nr:glycosyltransferase family 4 protein [Actinomycetospora sp. NBRC 106375]